MTYATNGWAALGDATRRTIFERLIDQPCAVSDLARGLPVSRPAVSQHLKVLKDAGLVFDIRAGKQRIYQVDPEGLAAFRAELDRFWSKTLATFKTVVEQPTEGDPMSIQAADTSVQTSIVVEAPVARAFKVFTEDFGSFKPAEHNMLGVEIAETVFEPKVGGLLYDRGVDGNVCRWARVLAYDPPNSLLLSWDISPQWQIETNLKNTSEVEVRFIAEDEKRTRVELEHRNLDRHGDGWPDGRDAVGSEGGWPLYLQRFADLIGKNA
jgi:DNA-binding transcriptional ArsR family regulator/uncharacterized protein YndB with AHSA1/START domain